MKDHVSCNHLVLQKCFQHILSDHVLNDNFKIPLPSNQTLFVGVRHQNAKSRPICNQNILLRCGMRSSDGMVQMILCNNDVSSHDVLY